MNQAANGVITSYDALTDMFESVEHFLKRLKIYTETSQPMPSVDEIVVSLMVELISMLFLVTQKLKKRRSRESLPSDVFHPLLRVRQSNG
jgi:hypothetical protein